MRFICLGCLDESLWNQLSPEEGQQAINDCFDYDDCLRRGGHFVGGQALASAGQAKTLRYVDGKVTVTDGPFAETKEMLGGLLFLEARDMDHAVELMSKHPGVRVGPFEIRPSNPEIMRFIEARDQALRPSIGGGNNTDDEAAVRDLVTRWWGALEARDLDRMMADYTEDAVLYDACPPYKTIGVANIRKVWEHCLPHFPPQFRTEHRDLQIHVSGDVAMVFGLHHFLPTPADHPCGATWMRITVGYRRIAGRWQVVHEHVSIPFNPMNGQAWYIKDPDDVSAPSYDSEGSSA